MSDIIKTIRDQFLKEAQNSPLLFNDLANMEKYISESYTGRSLIELLQNADDAGAKRFLIQLVDKNTYVVANDGREFTDEDILSLCRSGSSTKKRKGATIGFRGIGFKSVVNYAKQVHLVSGSVKTTFSRVLTKKVVPHTSEVPMIRIPHDFIGDKYMPLIEMLISKRYRTVFVFQVSNHSLSGEMEAFNSDAMIFLHSIQSVEFINPVKRKYIIKRKRLNDTYNTIQAYNEKNKQMWITTIPDNLDESCSVAFKYDGEKIVEADNNEAVIHSFMPTNNPISMPLKINGDFSTDPSRTKIVKDEDSYHAADLCVAILCTLIENILLKGIDELGVVNIIKKAKVDPLSSIRGEDINDYIVKNLKTGIHRIVEIHYGKEKSLYLQPTGMIDDDFEKIIRQLNCIGIGNKEDKSIPGILEMLRTFGYKYLPYEKSLEAMKRIECTEKTRQSVLVDTINGTRLGMSECIKKKITEAKLFSFGSEVTPVNNVNKSVTIDPVFEGAVTDSLAASSDYTLFAKRIGLKPEQLAINQQPLTDPKHTLAKSAVEPEIKSFSKHRVIEKWRSVEKNVAAVLESMDNVMTVADVSKQNIGYDLVARLNNGEERFYEVKSVNSLGDSFSFSNNEYSTAAENKEKYYLAITDQDDDKITVCFICNPIKVLHFVKRITRWEWLCDEYTGEVLQLKWDRKKSEI